MRPIYLDHHATTPVDPRVLASMLPYFTEKPGNAASSTHSFGWEASSAVEQGRAQIAGLIGAYPGDMVFTSGATESNNLALLGAADLHAVPGHIITMSTEHKAVLDPLAHLPRRGHTVTVLPPQPDGRLDVDLLRTAIRPETFLISVMFANNEIGVIQPVSEIGAICRERGVLFHCDAAQAAGKVAVDVQSCFIDLLSLSAHKMYGPKGVGALYVRRGVKLEEQIHGGGHEHGLRSGTLNVPGIVGFGAACSIAGQEMGGEGLRLAKLRDRLWARLQTAGGVRLNGSRDHRLPGNLNVSFAGVDGDALLTAIPEIAVSAASACSGASGSSYVVEALGVPVEFRNCIVRFGIGRGNTEEEIDYAAERLLATVAELRALSPVASLL
ncbi:MAG TPA: aminotransferase class V-fold PLP-dependent enzyme [Bryobacteraceae bacterium]|nr:aminotransferase class V-fold PLP-dependent enzyme [Bryobacteraceae bacterium]